MDIWQRRTKSGDHVFPTSAVGRGPFLPYSLHTTFNSSEPRDTIVVETRLIPYHTLRTLYALVLYRQKDHPTYTQSIFVLWQDRSIAFRLLNWTVRQTAIALATHEQTAQPAAYDFRYVVSTRFTTLAKHMMMAGPMGTGGANAILTWGEQTTRANSNLREKVSFDRVAAYINVWWLVPLEASY